MLQITPMTHEPMSTSHAARLLIVDDEAALMKALCDTLCERGFDAVGFTTGKAALAALRETRFDLLLADLMMPEMDGITLLRAALDEDPNLVGVIMTGQGTVETAVEAMKTGALDYILKPFKLGEMMPVLTRALGVRQLRMQNAELERQVRERTAALEAANKELEAFSYSVSHDLRAPLRRLDSYSSLLMENFAGQIPAEAHDLLNRIVANARRMGELIDALLRFSRLNQQPLSREPIDVTLLVEEVLAELRGEKRNQHLEVRAGVLPGAFGDPSLIRQVFFNLLSNAFKFTRHRTDGVIEVGSRQQDHETVYFVKDNGVGFDMRHAQHLFGVFQRLHPSAAFEGTGIGLSIVQRIVERHGGRVWAEAAVDEGATFFLTLQPEIPYGSAEQ